MAILNGLLALIQSSGDQMAFEPAKLRLKWKQHVEWIQNNTSTLKIDFILLCKGELDSKLCKWARH